MIVTFEHIPPGVRPEDNDAGTRSSLEKPARYVKEERGGSGKAATAPVAAPPLRWYDTPKTSVKE